MNDLSELAAEMLDNESKGLISYAVLFFEEAKDLLRYLVVAKEHPKIGVIELASEDFTGYTKEYYVSLSDDGMICVEEAWSDGNENHKPCYLGAEADVLYIDGNASAALLHACEYRECVELRFDDEDDGTNDGDCEDGYADDDPCMLYDWLMEHGKVNRNPKTRDITSITVDMDDLFDFLSTYFEVNED